MAYCNNCGTKIEDGVKFCPSCGTPATATAAEPQQQQFHQPSQPVSTPTNETQDAEQNKVMGVLAYFGLLVLVPIFAAKESKFARFHANQGLLLCIAWLGWWVVDSVISAILRSLLWNTGAWRLYATLGTLLNLVYIVFTVLAVIGIINALNGKMKELPVIGKFKLLK